MSPVALAGIWSGSGILAGLVLPLLRRRRLAWGAPVAAGLLVLLVSSHVPWPGPGTSAAYGGTLVLGRPGLGLLLLAGLALGVTLALAPVLDGGEVLTAGVVGGACVVALAATVPVVWSLAMAVAVGAMTMRWIAAVPGRSTLAAGRTAGLGAAALVAASAFIPTAGPAVDSWTALSGGLLAGGIAALLGLLPVGGWAVATASAVRGVDLAPWALLVAPSALLTTGVLLPGLPHGAQTALADVLLSLGLVSALFGGARAARSSPEARYPRVLMADVALAASGLGTTHAAGSAGVLLLLITHLGTAPLLLHGARSGTDRQCRLAWLALTGLPPTPAFWGRFLVLQGLAATSGVALLIGILAGLPLVGAAVFGLSDPGRASEVPPAGRIAEGMAWVAVLAVIAVGFAPATIAGHVFGVDLSTGG